MKATRLPLWAAVFYLIVTGGPVTYFFFRSTADGLWPLALECRTAARGAIGQNGVCGCSRDLRTLYTCRHADNVHAIRPFSFNGIGLTSIREKALDGSESNSFLSRTPAVLLSHNELTTLELGIFEGLGALRVLDLTNNSISSIAPGFFAAMPNLDLLLLRGNPISCSSVQPELPAGATCSETTYCDDTMCADTDNDCSLRPSWPSEEWEVDPTCRDGLMPLTLMNTSHLVQFTCCGFAG